MNKKTIIKWMVLPLAFAASACTDYQSSIDELNGRVDGMDQRLTRLEGLNGEISAIKQIVDAQQQAGYIIGVTQTASGYQFTMSNGTVINVRDGRDGTDGTDGTDGQDGRDGTDGHTPVIGVTQDTDDNWYWTVDGAYLLDGLGNKVRANGIDGTNGTNGTNGQDGHDGATPQLRVNPTTLVWEVSYDNGATWTSLGVKAQGDKGEQGDAFFESVVVGESEVTFTLADGTTTFTLPLMDTFKKVRDRVQSIVFIPENIDGMMTLQNGVQSTVRYRVMPEEVAAALATNYAGTLSFVGEEVAVTRGIAASAGITIDAVVNEGNGRLALTVTPSGMTPGHGYAFALVMNDGSSMYSTAYTSVFHAIPPVAIGIVAEGVMAGSGYVSVGDNVQLFAVFMPAETNMKGVSWTSSDTNVITVDANGLVTAHNNGTATITVTSTAAPAVSKSITVTVSDGSITLNTDDLVSQGDAE